MSRPDVEAYRRLYRGGPYGDLLSSLGVLADFAGDSSGYGYPAAPPNFFLMPPAAGSGMIEDQPHPSAQPLMIELQGNRYVRVSENGGNSPNEAASLNYQQPPVASSRNNPAGFAQPPTRRKEVGEASNSVPAAQDLQPAILVFRDGRTENVRDYAITAGMLYARGNYYTDGYWTKTINLASLNLPATISSNAERGVKFVLPSAPNEVVTRP